MPPKTTSQSEETESETKVVLRSEDRKAINKSVWQIIKKIKKRKASLRSREGD